MINTACPRTTQRLYFWCTAKFPRHMHSVIRVGTASACTWHEATPQPNPPHIQPFLFNFQLADPFLKPLPSGLIILPLHPIVKLIRLCVNVCDLSVQGGQLNQDCLLHSLHTRSSKKAQFEAGETSCPCIRNTMGHNFPHCHSRVWLVPLTNSYGASGTSLPIQAIKWCKESAS